MALSSAMWYAPINPQTGQKYKYQSDAGGAGGAGSSGASNGDLGVVGGSTTFGAHVFAGGGTGGSRGISAGSNSFSHGGGGVLSSGPAPAVSNSAGQPYSGTSSRDGSFGGSVATTSYGVTYYDGASSGWGGAAGGATMAALTHPGRLMMSGL